MRKYLFLLLALALLLCGCAEQKPEQTDTTPPPETQPIEFYVPQSAIEEQTQGEVRQYGVQGDCLWIRSAKGKLLVVMENCVYLMQGEEGTVVASLELNTVQTENWQILDSGYAYYDRENHSVQFLDAELNKLNNEILTEDMLTPVVSPDGSTIYYCQGEDVRAFEIDRKISRLIKSHSCQTQKLVDIYFEGKILECEIAQADSTTKTIYILTENGKTVFDGTDVLQMYTYGQRYMMERVDGIVHQWVVGDREGSANLIAIDEAQLYSALALNGIVGCTRQDDGVLLNFYNGTTGIQTDSVFLKDCGAPWQIEADAENNTLWLHMEDGRLLQWKVTETEAETASVFAKLYTAESPDKAGLKKLNERVSSLNSKYGVRIRIWDEAVKVTEGHILEVEYQTAAISQMLDELETVFAEFPKRFIQRSISSRVRICLVRSIDGETKSTQFWSDKYAFVVLASGVDMRSAFLEGFGYVVDSHVLGNSPVFDYWNALNPEGFNYGETVNSELISGDNRAFADEESMSSATADRSRIFWYAMQQDNAEMFKSEIMQSKLKMLCEGIRDAWRLEKETQVYLWEQYLTEPIAAKKK